MTEQALISLSKLGPEKKIVYRLACLSNACLDRYPHNRPSKFTHFLPEKLFLEPKKVYTISLLSLCLPTKTLKENQRPAFLQLHLSELSQQAFASPQKIRCLAQIVLPEREKEGGDTWGKNLHWIEIINPTPLVLDQTLLSLTELHFKFTDERGEELNLDSSTTPSILNCLIEELDSMDRFTVMLNSSQSKHLFPFNKDSEFLVSFGSHITKGEGWSVALHSVIVPAGITTLGSFFSCSIVTKTGEKKSVLMEENTGQKAIDMIDRLVLALAPYGVYIMRANKHHYSIAFEPSETRTDTMAVSLQFNASLCKLFSMPDYELAFDVSHKHFSQRLTFPHKDVQFIDEKTLKHEEQIVLYCSMVQSSVFGSERAPLIDILSSEKLGLMDSKIDRLYTVPQMIFRPVVKPDLKTVSLKITDIYGKPIELEYRNNKDEIQYVFVFQK